MQIQKNSINVMILLVHQLQSQKHPTKHRKNSESGHPVYPVYRVFDS